MPIKTVAVDIEPFSMGAYSRIRKSILAAPKHVVLYGRSRGERLTVKLFDDRSRDVSETIMDEQPYRHYVGFYNGNVTTDELRDDIESVICEKYTAWGLG